MKYAVCGVVKNEEPYLKEWLDLNILQGAEHFFITDNGSTDGTRDILQEYERLGILTYEIDPQDTPQFRCYNYWLNYVKTEVLHNHVEWLAFLDTDEFLYSPTGKKVSDILPEYEEDSIALIGVHWILYGGGTDLPLHEPVTRRFVYRAKEINWHVKSIVRPSFTRCVGNNPHYFNPLHGVMVNEIKSDISMHHGVIRPEELRTANVLRINHYHTKTYEEYYERKSTKPDPGTNRYIGDIKGTFEAHNVNEVLDSSLWDLWGSKLSKR